MSKTRISFDEKVENSKYDFCKNMKWFLIAPVLILVIGIVLLCTLGFNLGLDFAGGSNMTIFTNSEGTYAEYTSYDIDKDLSVIEEKVNNVLNEYGLKVDSILPTKYSDSQLDLENVDAVLVRYKNDNSLSTAEIEEMNKNIQLALLKEFGYFAENNTVEDLDVINEAGFVTNGGIITASVGVELVMISFIGLVVALAMIMLYVGLRFNFTSALSTILAVMFDLIVVASLTLICRIEINVSFVVAMFAVLCYSVYNLISVLESIKKELKIAVQSGKPTTNRIIANSAIKEILSKQVILSAIVMILLLLITIIGIGDVRAFALPILFGALSSFYTSTFIVPGLWALAYKPSKKKKVGKNISNTPSEKIEVVE